MLKNDDMNFPQERQNLEDKYRDSINELRKISWFIKVFIKMRKSAYEKKEEIKDQRIDMSKKTDSILFNNINNLYDSFDSFMKNSNSSLLSMEKDLAKPLDDFIVNQLNFHHENLKKMQNIMNEISSNKMYLENSENNYYFSSYLSSQFEDKDTQKAIFRGDKQE